MIITVSKHIYKCVNEQLGSQKEILNFVYRLRILLNLQIQIVFFVTFIDPTKISLTLSSFSSLWPSPWSSSSVSPLTWDHWQGLEAPWIDHWHPVHPTHVQSKKLNSSNKKNRLKISANVAESFNQLIFEKLT